MMQLTELSSILNSLESLRERVSLLQAGESNDFNWQTLERIYNQLAHACAHVRDAKSEADRFGTLAAEQLCKSTLSRLVEIVGDEFTGYLSSWLEEQAATETQGIRYKMVLRALPDGFDEAVAYEAGIKTATTYRDLYFSVLALDPGVCVQRLLMTASSNGIPVEVREIAERYYRIVFPVRYTQAIAELIDICCYANSNNIPGEGSCFSPLQWTVEHQRAAQRQGWDVVGEGPDCRLTYIPAGQSFQEDEEVWLHVWEMVEEHKEDETYWLCKHAIDYLAQQCPDEYKRVNELNCMMRETLLEQHSQLSEYGIVYRDEDLMYEQDPSDRD